MVENFEKIKKELKELKKKKSKKKEKGFLKTLSKKLPSKKILKTQRPTLTIRQREVPSVLGDPNRFFKEELEEVKRTMFFKWYSLTKRLI